MNPLTHFTPSGATHMVDVGTKPMSERRAVATGQIRMEPTTLELIVAGHAKKGDVLGTARLAGIMATKRTADLIPLCHPLLLTHVAIDLQPDPEQSLIRCSAEVATSGQTGVEMEALLAVQITLLTIYDMCKAVDRGMVLEAVQLAEKSGGRSGHWRREEG